MHQMLTKTYFMKTKKLALTLPLIAMTSLLFAQEGKVDTTQLNDLIRFSDTTHADKVMIIHKEEVIGYFNDPDCDSTHFNTASMVKSWTGIAVGAQLLGILIEKASGMAASDFYNK